jgi:hypothetical protein
MVSMPITASSSRVVPNARGLRDIKDHNRCENDEPNSNNHPINQCGCDTHDRPRFSVSMRVIANTTRLPPDVGQTFQLLGSIISAVRREKGSP